MGVLIFSDDRQLVASQLPFDYTAVCIYREHEACCVSHGNFSLWSLNRLCRSGWCGREGYG